MGGLGDGMREMRFLVFECDCVGRRVARGCFLSPGGCLALG